MSCNCQPYKLYRGGLPTWSAPKNDDNALCAWNILGLNSMDPCYNDCSGVPIPCYGYALNVVTPSNWTYPGLRHSNVEPDVNNCDQLISQTTADGSVYNGFIEPSNLKTDEHIFVGYAGNNEYHYARKDTDTGTWSSKNGMDNPKQTDDSNNKITDPAKAVFTLGGKPLPFCGYFTTSNNKVCPSDNDCVKGQQSGAPNPYYGCGMKIPRRDNYASF